MPDVSARGQVRRHRMSAGQRRESILKAAIEVFTTAGYRAGKVSDVAAKVGVTEPVIFQNFGSKAALFAAVLDRVAEDLRVELDTLVKRHGSAAELLAHVLSTSPPRSPHFPGEQGPHRPGGQQPDLPGGRGSHRPGGQQPDPPGGRGPHRPGGQQADLPSGEGPHRPGGQQPDPPGGRGPHRPGGQEPDLPGGRGSHRLGEQQPDPPSGEGPQLPGGQDPQFAGASSLAAETGRSDLGPLFADAVSLTAESEPSEPGRRILSTLAGHLTDLLRRGQADGDIRADLDAEAGAWLVLSILAARPLRAAMPDRDRLDSSVAALVLQSVVQPRPADLPG